VKSLELELETDADVDGLLEDSRPGDEDIAD
jgi:hypothetical protein